MNKNVILLLFTLLFSLATRAEVKPDSTSIKILLTGASFADKGNTWFEMGCEQLGAIPLNRAKGGEAIANTANKMHEGVLYTKEELEEIDAFVIMQVHNRDVYEDSQIKPAYTDYQMPIDRSNYAAAYDYVIKRYLSDCYNLKFDKNSRYYGSLTGKPALVVLCTDWHDARTLYNESVRKLAAKWGFPLVEFDKYAGFSKNQLHPVTGAQTSLIYSTDKQVIDGVTYGWHPLRGRHQPVQQRMAAVFADLMHKLLLIK